MHARERPEMEPVSEARLHRLGCGEFWSPVRGSAQVEQLPGFGDAGGGSAVFAGGDPGEGRELAPAEGLAGALEFLGDGAVVFFGVEGAVFAYGVLQQQVEDGAGGVLELAVAVGDGGGPGLEVALDGGFELLEERRG